MPINVFPALRLLLTLSLLECSWTAHSQDTQLPDAPRFPTVSFSEVLWSATPPYYSLVMDSLGNTTYESTMETIEQTGIPFTVKFPASPSTSRIIFRTVEQLRFLKEPVRGLSQGPANSSVKTLAYRDPKIEKELTYRSARNALVQQLTSLFQGVSLTLQFGYRLTYMREHGNKGIEAELQRMQQMAERGQLRELAAVTPLLRDIAADPTLDNSVRQRAEAVLRYADNMRSSSATVHTKAGLARKTGRAASVAPLRIGRNDEALASETTAE